MDNYIFIDWLTKISLTLLGSIVYLIRFYKKGKDLADKITIKIKRKKYWQEYWRKHNEDYWMPPVLGIIITIAAPYCVDMYVYLFHPQSDIDLIYIDIEYGLCFFYGLFSVFIMEKVFKMGVNKLK